MKLGKALDYIDGSRTTVIKRASWGGDREVYWTRKHGGKFMYINYSRYQKAAEFLPLTSDFAAQDWQVVKVRDVVKLAKHKKMRKAAVGYKSARNTPLTPNSLDEAAEQLHLIRHKLNRKIAKAIADN